MAKSLHPYDQLLLDEEEYIDMDIINSSILCYTISSPPHSSEFEFHMSTNQRDEKETTSPADELFYKGKLLPLHLRPRLRMVQMLFEETTTNPASPTKPLELKEDENCKGRHRNKSWPRRLNLGLKLKTSRAYLKSLFSPITRSMHEDRPEDEECGYRRSFSGVIPTTKSTMCTSDGNSSQVCVLKRSGSVNSDAENSIQGAIAYCKRSQQQVVSERKRDIDVGFCSFTVSRIAAVCEKKKNPGLYRG